MPQSARVTLTAAAIARLRALVDAHGIQGAAKRTGLTRHAVMGLMAAPEKCHAGTLALAAIRLAPSEPPRSAA